MRRGLVVTSAILIVVLSASCGRQPSETGTAAVPTALSTVEDAQIALPQTMATASETQSETETAAARATEQPPVSTTYAQVITTQPPVTTTKPPVTSPNQTKNGPVSFTSKELRYYTKYKENFTPTATVADSRRTLEEILRACRNGETQNGLREEDFAGYTDEWFRTHRLIVTDVQEGSGSIGHDVLSVAYTDSGARVTIRRTRPSVMTSDIAQRLILIELSDTRLQNTDRVELVWEDRDESSTHSILF